MHYSSPHLFIDRRGTVLVGAGRTSLDQVIEAHRKGLSAEAILARFPILTREELQSALDYHLQDGADGIDHGPHHRDARWQRWNETLSEDMGTDLPTE